MSDEHPIFPGMQHVSELLPAVRKKIKAISPIQNRLIKGSAEIADHEPDSILYQHTVLCQIGMPYRDPGAAMRTWDRKQGRAHLRIEAGSALHPQTESFVEIGLPFGPKPRIILAHLNAEALRTGSPVIEVENSLTAFVRRLNLPNKGITIRIVKDQLARLAAARVMLGIMTGPNSAATFTLPIVDAFELWFNKDDKQRVLWPSTVRLSHDYFQTLSAHAVPLDERAIANLSHSALGLDLYAWLAQRLHRIPPKNPQFITWAAIKDQFGYNYAAMFKFKQVFRGTLRAVRTQYPAARLEIDGRGITLRCSAPPVAKRLVAVPATAIQKYSG
jgi:hypothetical protein